MLWSAIDSSFQKYFTDFPLLILNSFTKSNPDFKWDIQLKEEKSTCWNSVAAFVRVKLMPTISTSSLGSTRWKWYFLWTALTQTNPGWGSAEEMRHLLFMGTGRWVAVSMLWGLITVAILMGSICQWWPDSHDPLCRDVDTSYLLPYLFYVRGMLYQQDTLLRKKISIREAQTLSVLINARKQPGLGVREHSIKNSF